MSNKDYSGTRKNISKTMLGNLAETLGFKKGLSYKQLMTEAASLSQKAVKQGLKRAGWKGAAALAALEAVGYGASKLVEKTKSTPTTKSNTKTYAQMVKEDKEKGKAKVLARRQPLPMSPKNKNRKEDPPKDSKKKVKPVEKKKPIIKKKKVVTPPKKKKNGVTFVFKVGGKKDGR